MKASKVVERFFFDRAYIYSLGFGHRTGDHCSIFVWDRFSVTNLVFLKTLRSRIRLTETAGKESPQ